MFQTAVTTQIRYKEFALEKSKAKMRAEIENNRTLKQGVWVYFLLLIFEGALRKWFLPSLAAPLLLVRDPVALYLLIISWRRSLLPSTPYISIAILIGLITIFTSIFLGHGNLLVAIYGARILLLHYPLIFVIGSVFKRKDIIQLGKVVLIISIFMAILTCLQFYSPQSSWVNRASGGIEGAGFQGARGYFRPPGTFSFTNGNTLFFGFVAPFVFYFWMFPNNINRFLLVLATLGLLAAIPLSISRTLFFSVSVSAIFIMFSVFRKPEYAGKVLVSSVALIVVFLVLNQINVFKTATGAFTERFESANETEGGVSGVLGGRYMGVLLSSIKSAADVSFFGHGLGSGSTVGLSLLGNNIVRGITEGEWGKWIYEIGPIFGISVILLRLSLSIKIFLASYRKLKRGDLLPWMLLSFGVLTLPQGEWSQATSLGFCVLTGGLMIASLNSTNTKQRIKS